jgi:hypothetical protein
MNILIATLFVVSTITTFVPYLVGKYQKYVTPIFIANFVQDNNYLYISNILVEKLAKLSYCNFSIHGRIPSDALSVSHIHFLTVYLSSPLLVQEGMAKSKKNKREIKIPRDKWSKTFSFLWQHFRHEENPTRSKCAIQRRK